MKSVLPEIPCCNCPVTQKPKNSDSKQVSGPERRKKWTAQNLVESSAHQSHSDSPHNFILPFSLNKCCAFDTDYII